MRTKYGVIFLAFLSGCVSQQHPQAPKAVVTFHSKDLQNFWHAFDKSAGKDEKECTQIFDDIYLKNGSQGLRDFYEVRLKNSKELCEAVIAIRPYYEKTRELMPNLDSFNEAILNSFNELKKMYPATSNVEVYYVIGKTATAGTIKDNKLLIGLEMFTAGEPNIDKKIVPKHLLAYKLDFLMIPAVAVHELIHTQQKFPDLRTLLENSVVEGVADFLAKKIHGKIINDNLFDYGKKNEKRLKKLFDKKKNGTDLNDFLYNSHSSKHPDMGYFIGYRITESYYDKATDKTAAIADMLHVSDFNKFVQQSNYLN